VQEKTHVPEEDQVYLFTTNMSKLKGFGGEEDHETKTFEQIHVYEKGEAIEDYLPVSILYRDPRVQENQENGGKTQ
jgi:hypothetical protein